MTETAFYSPNEVAARWGVSYQTVLKLIHRGELHAFRAGKALLVSGDALHDYETKPYVHTPRPRQTRSAKLKIT